jgi:RNA polymerase sigma factor (sigma-70 family)
MSARLVTESEARCNAPRAAARTTNCGDNLMASMTKNNHKGLDCTRPAPHHIPKRVGLSRDEECELAGLIAHGDHDARDRLVLANLGLAVVIAGDFRHRGLEMDDLIGEGNLGLLRAAEKFDPSFGIPFSTYARNWIREKILAALMNTVQTIRIPAHLCRLLLRWRRTEEMLGSQLGRKPTFQDVAAVLYLNPVQKAMVSHALASQSKTKGPGGANRGTIQSANCGTRAPRAKTLRTGTKKG